MRRVTRVDKRVHSIGKRLRLVNAGGDQSKKLNYFAAFLTAFWYEHKESRKISRGI